MNKEQVFQTAREQVLNSYPSIFTKDDVIRLIVDLEKSMEGVVSESKNGIDREKLEEILDKYNSELRDHIEYRVDTSDMWSDDKIEMSVSYREICIDEVEIDLAPVCESIEDFHKEFDLDEYFVEENVGSEFVAMDDDSDNDE
jgi:hypothetical protein